MKRGTRKWYWLSAGGRAEEAPRLGRSGRRFPPLDLHGASLRRADLSATDLSHANFAGTDFSNANLRGSDFAHADLRGAILRGADLRDARNLTAEQLADAVIDETTSLPSYLSYDALMQQREGVG